MMDRRGQYAQDIFTLNAAYFQGRPPKSVNMYWRRFKISSIPLYDPIAFEKWLRNRWIEKDRLIEMYLRTGRFPADYGVDRDASGQTRRGVGYVEAEIKSFHWYEFLQVFAPVGILALVLFMFYGSLPMQLLQAIDKDIMIKKLKAFAEGSNMDGKGKKASSATGAMDQKLLTAGPPPANQHLIKRTNSTAPPKLKPLNPMSGIQKAKISPGPHPKLEKTRVAKPRKLEVRHQKLTPSKKPSQSNGYEVLALSRQGNATSKVKLAGTDIKHKGHVAPQGIKKLSP